MSTLVNGWMRNLGPRDFIEQLKLLGSNGEALACLYDYVLYDLTERDGYIYTSGLFALWSKELMGDKLTRGFLFITDNKPQLTGMRNAFLGAPVETVQAGESHITSSIGLSISNGLSVKIGLQYQWHNLPVVITSPLCGTQVIYKNINMVPPCSIRCPCGDPRCWLIKVSD